MPAHPKHAAPSYPILPVIAERWSPYAYDPRPVEREKLLSCLEAARWAPSSYNEQPWTFILAERTDQAAFAQALDCLVEGNRGWAKNVGVLMLTVVARNFTKNGKPEQSRGARPGPGGRQHGAASDGARPARASDDRHRAGQGASRLQSAGRLRSAHGNCPRLSGRRSSRGRPIRSASATWCRAPARRSPTS